MCAHRTRMRTPETRSGPKASAPLPEPRRMSDIPPKSVPRKSAVMLEGSCHCGAIRFRVRSAHPYPFNLCYCSICRKTGGGGGYAINLGAEYESLEFEGDEHRAVYHAVMRDGGAEHASPAERSFCRRCGTSLWLWDPRWPDLVHPLASAIDTPLPVPPERTHLMLGEKPDWVRVESQPGDRHFDAYPDESLAEWHERLGLSRRD